MTIKEYLQFQAEDYERSFDKLKATHGEDDIFVAYIMGERDAFREALKYYLESSDEGQAERIKEIVNHIPVSVLTEEQRNLIAQGLPWNSEVNQ